ncbi:hypothetical protein HYDPIDRAFT_91911 [Hydnomerulius pinastri MD-312]|uniref:Uncharacterized protein n=1 Tax=Hydnomerulius pinastri MD-312 TaxID=994086 RepID=A0A0C9VE60_9AGAM|nr:hypothetical protein HYDPIDRAFT_91911 [Hydnomerulius pinastri MD-312]
MSTKQILDSSPVPIPSLRDADARSRPLKRSASVVSLPTPPRTHHKRSRSRTRSSASRQGSDDSGTASELDDDLGGGYAARIKRAKITNRSGDESSGDHTEDESRDRKKRRTALVLPGHDEEEEDENAFWRGRSGTSASSHQAKERKDPEEAKESENSPSPALLRYRVKAPVSPPPSRRQPQIQPARAASVERAGSRATTPVTPPRKLFLRAPSPSTVDAFKTPIKPKATKIWPRRDSPNNPFLADASEKSKLRSEWDSSDEEDEVVGEARIREGTPTPAPTFEEKPTITYVFRGQKATFQNPLYGLPAEVVAASKLPLEHPDYEVTEACPPKRLFSGGKRKSRDRSRESTSSEGVKRAKILKSEIDRNSASSSSEGEQSTDSRKRKPLLADAAEHAVLPSKPAREGSMHRDDADKGEARLEALQRAREDRERRETAAKTRLGSKEGLRAGAVVTERDEPARRAMGPVRSA